MLRITFFTISIFFSVISNAQDFIYSNTVGNDNEFTHAKVIGRVKENIVIYKSTWSTNGSKSEILVYDDKMKLLNTISLDPIVSQFAFVDFINEKDSFAAIIVDKAVHPFVYKLVSFDAGGNILNDKVLETSESGYEIVKSASSSFALLKVVPSNINGTIAIQYYFVKNNALIHSDTVILPFNELSSTLGAVFLDNDNLVLPVNDTSAVGGTLALFKVDLNNNSSINTIRNLNNDFLITGSIAISENANHYTVTASAANNDQDLNAISKIFLWQINKDLTDISSDTVFTNVDSINPCLQNMFSYQLNNFAMSNNSSAIIISPAKANFFSDNMQRIEQSIKLFT